MLHLFLSPGETCEKVYPICQLSPCHNQGTCMDTPTGSVCFCKSGFEGRLCHKQADKNIVSKNVRPEAWAQIKGNTSRLESDTRQKGNQGIHQHILN